MNKIFDSALQAVADIPDGASVIIGGFGGAGTPYNLVDALLEQGAKGLTIISNGLAQPLPLLEKRRVKKLVASFASFLDPRRPNPLEEPYRSGEAEVELVPQGTFIERIRAGGAGIAGFYTPTGAGTVLAKGKETRIFDSKEYLLEPALKADFALIKGFKGDRLGNLIYRMAARNFNPVMAMAAKVTIAEVEEIVAVGELNPDCVHTPGIFVHRVVKGEKRSVWFFK